MDSEFALTSILSNAIFFRAVSIYIMFVKMTSQQRKTMVNTKDDHRKLQIKEEEKSTMKKMNLAGIIAAMTIAASTLTVPCMAQGQITEAQARQIALKDAGLTEDQVTFVRSQVDYDDGMEQFDVKFYVGMTEYSYDIDANTGRIVDYDIEIDD